MKHLLIALLLIVCGSAFAQLESPFGNIRHSAADQNGNLHLRWDDFTGGEGVTECYYSSGTNNWTNAATTVYSSTELEALVPYSYGQKLRYRLRYALDYMGETICMLHPAFWDAEAFPPNPSRMAYISTDATGDSVSVYNPHLDIEQTYTAMGPQKLYFSMENSSGQFPTMNSLTSFNVYMALIINPEAMSDSVAYAMVYSFNIPGLISNGLYKLGLSDESSIPTFARLGNIQAQVSSGILHLACTLSDLTSDPDFGAWPNASHSLVMESATVAVAIENMQPNLAFGDYGSATFLLMEDNYYQQTANTLPTVEVSSFDPYTNTLTLNYYDSQGDFPLTAEVRSGYGTPVEVQPVGSDYSNPVSFVAQIPYNEIGDLPWRFSDNDVDFVSGVYHAVANDDPVQTPSAISCIMPNPVREFPLQLKLEGLDKEHLTVDIYNIRGQKVVNLYNSLPSGKSLELNWNGLIHNQHLPAGMYFITINQHGRRILQKFIATP